MPVVLLLVGLAFFVSLRVRRRHTRGGLTERAPAPGVGSGGAQDRADGEDRGSFETQVHGGGTR